MSEDDKRDAEALARIQELARKGALRFEATTEADVVPDWALEKVERALMFTQGVDDRMLFISDRSRISDVTSDPDELGVVSQLLDMKRALDGSERIVDVARWIASRGR